MSVVLKTTTNLTGLNVAKNAKNKLLNLYRKTLKELNKMPETSFYRQHTEELVKYRASIVERENCLETIEKKIGCGQIEELLIQAENELNLSRKFLIWEPWKPLKTPIPQNQWKWPL